MKGLFREIIAIIFLIFAVILLIGLMFYDDLKSAAEEPIASTYEMTPTQREIVREKEEYMNSQNSIILTAGYTIDAEDLSQYKSTGNLTTGQSSPFDEFVVTEITHDAIGNTYYQITSTAGTANDGKEKGEGSGSVAGTSEKQPESTVYKPSSDISAPSTSSGNILNPTKTGK